jgi:hypothetical protein
MEYLAQCVAVAEGKRSGLPLGTRPDSVTRAKSILLGSLRGGGGGMTSNVSTVSSLVYGSPRHFFNAMATARAAAGVPVRTVRRTARGRKPSSAAEPSGSPRRRLIASSAMRCRAGCIPTVLAAVAMM